MSLTGIPLESKQALSRKKVALLARLRQNMLLKVISLAASILLYVYVQGERNPTVSRPFTAPILYAHRPEDVEIQTDQQQNKVNVSGPRSVLDLLKDGDIRIRADFGEVPRDRVSTLRLRTRYELVGSANDHKADLTFDPPEPPHESVVVFPQKTQQIAVTVHFSREAPAGFQYAAPLVNPPKIAVTGRVDRVNRIARAAVNAVSIESGATIEGDYLVSARDGDDNQVDGVTLTPPSVHVTIPRVEAPYSKIVSVSADVREQPASGYTLQDLEVTPNQVRVFGRPQQVNRLTTLLTNQISVHDRMEDMVAEVGLALPAGVMAQDADGKTITHVHVRVKIHKLVTPTAPPPPGGDPSVPPTSPN